MKRMLLLLSFFVVFGMAIAQAPLAPLPDDAQFDQKVEFTTGVNGETLRSMLTALAQSVGLTAVVDDVPDKTIVYDIGDPKPFRQVFNIVLTLNDLDYVLLPNDVVVIGTTAAVKRLRTEPEADAAQAASPAEDDIQRFYRVNNDPAQVVQILQRAVPGLDVQALPGVKSIVVVAPQDTQDRVQALLQQFDTAAEVTPLEQRTYFLSNANAADLATVLQSTGVVASTDPSQPGQTIDSFTVVAEPRTNSLIVTGTPAVQARLAELIPSLDAAQQQVNIQVRIQEVGQSTEYNLGLNLSAGFGNLSSNILDTGLEFIFDMSKVVSSLNILAVLDALETQGLSRRVDDSNITVLDNEKGTIQSGGTIFISIPGSDGNIERTIPYGVQVDVTPRIANDGRVTLVITAKVEDVLSQTNDPSFLNISTRAVTSTVTLAPGQTALLGGLLQNSVVVTKNRIPVIGMIPIVGDLLGHTSSTDKSSDLLLVVNAQIID